jgi:hypothetical protein
MKGIRVCRLTLHRTMYAPLARIPVDAISQPERIFYAGWNKALEMTSSRPASNYTELERLTLEMINNTGTDKLVPQTSVEAKKIKIQNRLGRAHAFVRRIQKNQRSTVGQHDHLLCTTTVYSMPIDQQAPLSVGC